MPNPLTSKIKMPSCPLVKHERRESRELPRFRGQTLATVLAFGLGFLVAAI